MSQNKKSNLISGLVVIILASLITVAIIYAWTEPTSPPPGGNVPAPLNVGNVAQIKEGSLILNSAGSYNPGLTVNRDFYVLNGNVGIGTTTPGDYKLNVQGGDIKVGSAVTIKGDGTVSTGLNAEKVGGYTSADLLAAGGTNSCGWFRNGCPSGFYQRKNPITGRVSTAYPSSESALLPSDNPITIYWYPSENSCYTTQGACFTGNGSNANGCCNGANSVIVLDGYNVASESIGSTAATYEGNTVNPCTGNTTMTFKAQCKTYSSIWCCP